MKAKETLKFSEFTHQMVNNAFDLKQEFKKDLLENWRNKAALCSITLQEKEQLKRLCNKLFYYHLKWNEYELQTKFIAHITELVNFDNLELQFGAFSERKISSKIKSILVQGNVDWMAASGAYEPQVPFFFIHEYKKGTPSDDPIGQLLATMYVAQHKNHQLPVPDLFDLTPKTYTELPINGCYIIGKAWYFVTLFNDTYYISDDYDATKLDELMEIVKILKAEKERIIDVITN